MKKQLIALAAAAAIAPAAFANNASFGGDANVEGFMSRADMNGTEDVTDVDNRGYTNRIRVKGTYKTDGNVSVNTRIILNDSSWTGDNHSGGVQGAYQNSANDAVAVDYGYIQAPILGWTFRFGRQVANWGNCFLTCDDRRDRIMAMKRFGGTTLIFLNDKRASAGVDIPVENVYTLSTTTWVDADQDDVMDAGEVTESYTQSTRASGIHNELEATGEGDLYTGAAIGVINGWQWGVLVGKWIGETGYALDEVYAISPFVKGKAGRVKLEGTLNILGGGDDDATSKAFFTDSAVSAYVKAGMQAGPVMLEGQVVVVSGGGLVAGGFDSFSMLISNNPDNSLSNVTVDSLGGLGTTAQSNDYYGYGEHYFADDEVLVGFRASGKSGKIGWKAAITHFSVTNDYDDEAASEKDYSILTIDGGLTYSVAKSTELYLNAAIGSKSNNLDDSGDSDFDYQAATIGINTTF